MCGLIVSILSGNGIFMLDTFELCILSSKNAINSCGSFCSPVNK